MVISKNDVIFDFLYKKKTIFQYASWLKNEFKILTSDMRTHLVASERSYQKNDVILEFLDQKKLYFNKHLGKMMDLKF